MVIPLTCLTALFLFAVALTVRGILTAPEGHEDSKGFHYVWLNNTPDTANVVCIWKTVGEQDMVSEAVSQESYRAA